MNNDDISHFSTIPASFAIKSNVYFLTHQYLIINNSQSQRALSVSVRTVLWMYFASRRNCGLLTIASVIFLSKRSTTYVIYKNRELILKTTLILTLRYRNYEFLRF